MVEEEGGGRRTVRSEGFGDGGSDVSIRFLGLAFNLRCYPMLRKQFAISCVLSYEIDFSSLPFRASFHAFR